MIKIAITGTQSTGKSTLSKKIHDICRRKGLKTILVSEVADNCPHPINEPSTVEAQNWIFHEQLRQETMAQNENPSVIVCDRSIMDSLCYLPRVDGDEVQMLFSELYSLAHEWMHSYDYVVRLPLDLEWLQSRNNPKRSKNVDFARRIDAVFNNLVDCYVNVSADDLVDVLRRQK